MADNPYSPPRAASEPDPDEVGLAVSIVCPACRSNIHIGDDACKKCGRGVTKDEKRALERRWEASDPDVATASDNRYWGQVSIAVAAALALIQAAFLAGIPAVMMGGLAVALVLCGLFVWSFRSPLAACVCALAVYSLWWLGQLVFVTLLAFDGLLLRTLRIVILASLMAGASAEWNMRRQRRAIARSRS
jgi:hypothetical protein